MARATQAALDLRLTLPQSLDEARASRVLSLQVLPAFNDPPRIPGYELEQVLGQGAFASVWQARQTRTQKRVAVKIFKLSKGPHWLFLQREVERLSLLDKHPHIVSLLDADLTGDPPYYTMDLIERGSLQSFVDRGVGIDPERAAKWMEQLGQALAYVHAKGLIHCDLKPANLLLDDQDNVRLMDFGHSRILTASSGTLGTFFYMAPEQTRLLDSRQPYQPDVRWDLFALGSTFFALLSGRTPWGRLAAELEKQEHLSGKLQLYREEVAKHPLPDLQRLTRGRVDRDLAAIVARCCSANPDQRYASALELLSDLRARRELRPVSALADQWPYKALKFLRRNRAAMGVAGLGLALLLGWGARQALIKQGQLREQVAQLYALRSRERAEAGDTLAAAAYADAANLAAPSRVAAWNLQHHLPAAPVALLAARADPRPVFLPDGQRAVLGWRQGQLAVLDLRRGAVARVLEAPSPVEAFALSPDGRRVAGASADGSVRVWDLGSGQRQGPVLRTEHASAPALAWSPDGQRLALGLGNGRVRLWRPAEGAALRGGVGAAGAVRSLAFAPDQRSLACLSQIGANGAAVLDLLRLDAGPEPRPALRLPLRSRSARMEHFDAGRSLAVLEADGGLRILTWRQSFFQKAWVEVKGLPPPARAPRSSELARGGRALLRIEADGRLRLWALAQGALRPLPAPGGAAPKAAVLDPDGSRLAVLSRSNTLRIWDPLQARPLGPALQLDPKVRGVALPEQGGVLVLGPRSARLHDPATGEPLGRAFYWEAEQELLAGPGGRWLLHAPQTGEDERLLLPAARRGSHALDLSHREGAGAGLAVMDAEGDSLLSAWRNQARFWSLEDGRRLGPELRLPGPVLGAHLDPGSKRALLLHARGARLWDRGRPSAAPQHYAWPEAPRAVAFRKNGDFVTGDAAGDLQLWSPAQARPLARWPRAAPGLLALQAQPDGSLVCLTEGSLLWLGPDARPRRPALALPAPYQRFQLSPDGGILLAALGRELRLFDSGDGQPLGKPLLLDEEPQALALSPDGSVLAAAAGKGIRLYDAASGQALGERLEARSEPRSLAFSRSGLSLLAASDSGAHRVWVLPWLRRQQPSPQALHALSLVATHLQVGPAGDLQRLPYDDWKSAWKRAQKEAQP